ncbi:MAG TPA: spore germination protein [Ureibacillus sp.]|nr:spore germination protein [Ureibacillus sp.]
MNLWQAFTKKRNKEPKETTEVPPTKENQKNNSIVFSYKKVVEHIQLQFGKEQDFRSREIELGGEIPATIFFLCSLVDKESISKDVIQPLLLLPNNNEGENQDGESINEFVIKKCLYHAEIQVENQLPTIVTNLLRGNTILLIDGIQNAIVINTKKIDKRSISQPDTEQVIRGPRDGFIESLETNVALLRERLPIADFKVKPLEIGSLTKSSVCLFYIEGIANPSLIKDVEDRLSKIEIDRILDAGYIEQFIQDNPRSPFPQVKNTERPDVAVGNLIEGRAILMVNGSPFALIVPATFIMFYQSSEDYNERTNMTSIIRFIRLVSIVFSLITPSAYVAVISYHPELIPTAFSVAITSGRAGVPFPAVIEVFVMEAAMEILREATVRMPKQVGGALSIVGVLVVGQAAVMAGFVSPITVVVIAITTIGSFSTPAYSMATGFRMLRFPLLFLTGILGIYGLVLGLILIINHLISLRSFGVPYFSPISPMNWGGMKDTFIRAPLRWLIDRPEELKVANKKRVQNPKEVPATNPLGPENQKGGGS